MSGVFDPLIKTLVILGISYVFIGVTFAVNVNLPVRLSLLSKLVVNIICVVVCVSLAASGIWDFTGSLIEMYGSKILLPGAAFIGGVLGLLFLLCKPALLRGRRFYLRKMCAADAATLLPNGEE